MSQYLKPDTELGYIEDQAEIENLKFDNARHTILGCMLGDFDETGAYVVSPEIVKELIEMPKFIVETMDNIEICKGVLKLDKQTAFMVTFEGNKATLSLIEKLNYEANFALNSGTYSNINEYVLDSVETSGEINRNAIYLRWNIGNYEGDTVDVFNCDPAVLEKYFGIVNRFKYLLKANQELLEKEVDLEEIEAAYANEVLAILRRYPKLYEQVMAQIKTAFAEKENAITHERPNFTKTFNELLENAIHANISVLSLEEIEAFNIEKRNAIVNMNVQKSAILEMQSVENEALGEFINKVIQFKILSPYDSQSIEILSKDYAAAYKASLLGLSANNQGGNKAELINALVQMGLIKIVQQEKAVGTLVAETVEKVQAKQSGKAVKKAAGGSAAKKAGGKSAGGAKKGGGKNSKDKAKKAKGDKEKEEVENKPKKIKKKKSVIGTAAALRNGGSFGGTVSSGGDRAISNKVQRKRDHIVGVGRPDTAKVKEQQTTKVNNLKDVGVNQPGEAVVTPPQTKTNENSKGIIGKQIDQNNNLKANGSLNNVNNPQAIGTQGLNRPLVNPFKESQPGATHASEHGLNA